MNDFVELTKTIQLVLRYWWIVAVAAAIAIIIGLISTLSTTPVYQAKTTVAVGQFIDAEDLGNWYLDAGEKLTLTYVNIARREPVLQGVIDELNLTQSWQSLREQVSVTVIADTQLIEITTSSTDPILAIDISASVANQLALQAPDPLEIDPLEAQTAPVSPNGNQLKVIEPAFIDVNATSPSLTLNLAISGFVGIALGLLAILLINLFDKTIRSLDDLKGIPNLSVLGTLKPVDGLIPTSARSRKERQAAELFQVLRSRISIRQRQESTKPILVTTPSKSTNTLPLASNIALAFANSGQETLLLNVSPEADTAQLEQDISTESTTSEFYGKFKLAKGHANTPIPELINQLTTRGEKEDDSILERSITIVNGAALLDSAGTDKLVSLTNYGLLVIQSGVNQIDDVHAAVACLNQIGVDAFDVVLLENGNTGWFALPPLPFFNSQKIQQSKPSNATIESYAQETPVADEALQGGD